MEVTFEIDDDLVPQAEVRAAERGEPLRALLERAVRRELEAMAPPAPGRGLRNLRLHGGIGVGHLLWRRHQARDAAYDDREYANHKYGSLRYPDPVKTTIELNDELLRRAKLRAAERGETLRALLERGLQRELDATDPHTGGYVLRDASVGGGWLRDGHTELDWDKIREEDTRWRVFGE